MSLNKATLIGSLGKDPEIKTLSNGSQMATFSVATSEGWKDKNTGEWKNQTEWHKIVVFGEGIVKYIINNLHKGSKVYIEGKIQTREYEKDGVKTYSTSIAIQGFSGKLLSLDSKQGGEPTAHNAAKSNGFQTQRVVNDMDDEIPF